VEIEFQAQQIGAASIKVVQGSTGTQLLRPNGTALTFTPNELSVQISAAQSNTGTGNTGSGNTGTGNTGGTQTGTTGGTGTSTGTTQVPIVIPNTGIEDYYSIFSLIGGVFLVSLGVILLKTKPKKRGLEP
jgi:LPXTG-motif cell wall-anchored protein